MTEFELKNKKVLGILSLIFAIIVILLGIFVFSKVSTYSGIITVLDEKKSNVTSLLAGSTAASTLITLLPNDVGTPIAEKLADLSSIFLLILAVLYLEKYLLTILGTTSSILATISLVMYGVAINKNKKIDDVWLKVRNWAIKLFIGSIVLITIIPISTRITKSIDKIYAASIQEKVDQAIDSSTNEEIATEEKTETESKSIWDTISDTFSSAVDTVTSSASESYEWAKETLNRFVEATAIMLVTSCVIPLLTLAVVMWLAKMTMESITKKSYPLPPALPPRKMLNKIEEES